MSEPTAYPWFGLRGTTRARIGLGRTGDALPVRDILAFQLAHAKARDAVHTPLDTQAVAASVTPRASVTVHSMAPDRETYLRRPDLGRQLDPASAARLTGLTAAASATPVGRTASVAAPGQAASTGDAASVASTDRDAPRPSATPAGQTAAAALAAPAGQTASPADPRVAASPSPASGAGWDAVFVIADGLSPVAVQRHAPPLLLACLQRLAGWSVAPIVIATQARVALGDEIGACLNAELCAVLIGERPGLSVADSLGVYLTYRPRTGRRDAERNCISNIHADGLSYDAAADMLSWLMTEARRRKLTGIDLKDDRAISAPAVTSIASTATPAPSTTTSVAPATKSDS
ncbi:MAG TPA: ethanolamine ammonia-lyase light chain EutC [Rhodopila sp.]